MTKNELSRSMTIALTTCMWEAVHEAMRNGMNGGAATQALIESAFFAAFSTASTARANLGVQADAEAVSMVFEEVRKRINGPVMRSFRQPDGSWTEPMLGN